MFLKSVMAYYVSGDRFNFQCQKKGGQIQYGIVTSLKLEELIRLVKDAFARKL